MVVKRELGCRSVCSELTLACTGWGRKWTAISCCFAPLPASVGQIHFWNEWVSISVMGAFTQHLEGETAGA